MSVVPLIVPVLVPPERLKTTVRPPEVSGLPMASRAIIVSVIAAPEATVLDDTLMVDWASELAPGTTVMLGSVLVTGTVLIVAPIFVAVPAVVPVNVAT